MSRIKIFEKFDMKQWSLMSNFIAVTHGSSHVLRNIDLFSWYFCRNPQSNLATILNAWDGEKLIAILGYIPTKFLFNDRVILGVWMAHWVALSEYRSGVGALLMRKITEIFPLVAGQGASQMNEGIVKKMGFTFVEEIPKVVFIFSPHKIMRFGKFERSLSCGSNSKYNNVSPVRKIDCLSELLYLPNWALYPALRYGTLRDCEYISNRYLKYPFFEYEIFIIGAQERPSLLVCRIINASDGIKVGRVLEFITPEDDFGLHQARELILHTVNFMEASGCDYIDFYCTSKLYIKIFQQCGFVIDGLGSLPSLLDPIDTSRKYQNFELKISKELHLDGAVNEFIVMRGDGDQDRPNQSLGFQVRTSLNMGE